MNRTGDRFQLHRAFFHPWHRDHLTRQCRERAGREFVLLKPEFVALILGYRVLPGFCPVRGARASTWRHMSGDGILTTHSGRFSRFLSVLVSVRSPSVIVHPSAQKEEIGARFGVSSSFRELVNATGFPKWRILGSIVANCEFGCVCCIHLRWLRENTWLFQLGERSNRRTHRRRRTGTSHPQTRGETICQSSSLISHYSM